MTAAVAGVQPEAAGWRPSFLGKLFCNTRSWSLQVHPDMLRVHAEGLNRSAGPVEVPAEAVSIRPGRIWSAVFLETSDISWELPGLPREKGRTLEEKLNYCRHLAALRAAFQQGIDQVASWSTALEQELRG